MNKEFDYSLIIDSLIHWYSDHARDLPWRRDITPYRVWVSEIMLQQTRVEAVKPYYARFMEELPDIKSLAECPEDKLLKLWEGLGYYNRVRNMQKCARIVMEEYDGELPADHEKLLSLPGIGTYTAGAIASLAFSIPVPAVDGNVLRVIMRVSGDDSDIAKESVKKEVSALLADLMKERFRPEKDARAGILNSGLMELGATVCLPNGRPYCNICPWRMFCRAFLDDRTEELPIKSRLKARRIEEKTVLLVMDGDRIVLRKRPAKGLLAGLYEFPNVKGHLTEEEALNVVRKLKLSPLKIKTITEAKHIFSHVEWHMKGYVIKVDSLTSAKAGLLFVEQEEVEKVYPIPAAFSAYVKAFQDMRK